MTFEFFGEITSSNGESKYAYANALALTLLGKLKDIERYEHLQESDIVNAGLIFLNLFFNLHIDCKCVEETQDVIKEMTFDENEFTNFFKIAINHCKMHNIMINDGVFCGGEIDGF